MWIYIYIDDVPIFSKEGVLESLVGFHLRAIMSNAAMNIGLQSFESLFSVIWDIYLVELLNHMVTVGLAF